MRTISDIEGDLMLMCMNGDMLQTFTDTDFFLLSSVS